MIESTIPSAGFGLESLMRGVIGMTVLLAIAYAFSSNRKAINWRVVGIGLSIQLVLAIGVLYVPFVKGFFEFVGDRFVNVMDFTKAGIGFLFNSFSSGAIESPLQNFAIMILPTIVFFSALTSVLFFLGIIQKIVKALAVLLTKLLRVSGPESLSVAGNIFLGQTEAPLMIKAYLEKMNRSEILLVMIGGMATVAGGVLAAYISFLGGDDPVQQRFYAKHLLAASVMAAPGAIVVAKMLMPQTEKINSDVHVDKQQVGSNILDAMTNGTTEGLKLALNVGAMLLVFFAFIAMFNFIMQRIGYFTGLRDWLAILIFAVAISGFRQNLGLKNWSLKRTFWVSLLVAVVSIILYRYSWITYRASEELSLHGILPAQSLNQLISSNTAYDTLSLEFILGFLFAPLMWLMGVAKEDTTLLGQLLGVKLIASEFVGYINLAEMKEVGNTLQLTYDKSILMATYMLCGFANFASIGIQVGGIGSLAPGQRKVLSSFGVKALIGGTLASLFSATLAGMLVG
ncbi:NupC/NupG family nucleoside CNT transporter [Marinicella sp. W31]|uniref:NupC/NupG family nucleoside CNT transporter n=1 Tax=Marinicella sp. W31 TaxID=3023713 RepID=UPI003757268E